MNKAQLTKLRFPVDSTRHAAIGARALPKYTRRQWKDDALQVANVALTETVSSSMSFEECLTTDGHYIDPASATGVGQQMEKRNATNQRINRKAKAVTQPVEILEGWYTQHETDKRETLVNPFGLHISEPLQQEAC
jgi:hypothetical protein